MRRTFALSLCPALSCLGLLACGDGGVGSCTITETSGSTSQIIMCEEVPANLKAQLQQTCSAMTNGFPPDAGAPTVRFADGACTHQGALGGCKMSAGGASMTIWYYTGNSSYRTADDLKQFCQTAGYTYISP